MLCIIRMIDRKVSQPFTKHSFIRNQSSAFSESLHLHASKSKICTPLAKLLTCRECVLAPLLPRACAKRSLRERFAHARGVHLWCKHGKRRVARGKVVAHAHVHDLWRRASRRARTRARQSKAHLISILLLGFLSGNLFGTVLNFLRGFIIWDLFIIATLLFIIEFTGYMAYSPRITKQSERLSCVPKRGKEAWGNKGAKSSTQIFDLQARVPVSKIKAINFFKVGIMIGFFVDAFKVGS